MSELGLPDGETSLLVLDTVTNYEKLHRLGEGTYGVVYKAKDRRTGEIVALKKVRFDRARDGVPVTSIRELRVLQECQHPNIVQLKTVVTGSKADSMFLVFEYCEHDMGRLLDALPTPFTLPQIKCLIKQLLQAVRYLHTRWVVHRDIKMSNLLYTRQGVLKLCDFGLARYFQPSPSPMTPNVVTLWYRAPEILLGAEVYDEAVDMWSVGCVLAELVQHSPLFPAASELECLKMQCALLGTPTPKTWPGITSLPHYHTFTLPSHPSSRLGPTLGAYLAPAHHAHHARHPRDARDARHIQGEGGRGGGGGQGVDLLAALLTFDPARRITAAQALRHPWLTERPYPIMVQDMPTFPDLVDHNPSYRPSNHHNQHRQYNQHSQALGGQQGAGTQGNGHHHLLSGQKRAAEGGLQQGFDARRVALAARACERDRRFADAFR